MRLTPKGGRDGIDGIDVLSDGRSVLKARVRAAPSEGEANDALCKLIAKAVGVPPRDVELVAGATARIKRLIDFWRWPNAGGGAGEDRRFALMLSERGSDHDGQAAHIIDGKTIAANLRGNVADAVHRLKRDRGLVPGLAVVLVGKNPASEVYVRNKIQGGGRSRHASVRPHLPETVSEAELLDADRGA